MSVCRQHLLRLSGWLAALWLCSASILAEGTGLRVDTIDYAHPENYLEIADTLGNKTDILAQATELRGRNQAETVANIVSWIPANLQCAPERAYRWRNYDTVTREKAYASCADQAIFCGVLLKAAGIPAVWVKTMDVSWIWDFGNGREFESWSGHVFLEIYLDGRWALLDVAAGRLYTDYSTGARLLPGNRFAYHKGNDPYAMIFSMQWEEWKRQTADYFSTFDTSLLPVDVRTAAPMGKRAYVVANSPGYKLIEKRLKGYGYTVVRSFNTGYETYLPEARGACLFVETMDGTPTIPIRELEKYFPAAGRGLKKINQPVDIEGTRIVFLDMAELD